jgi:cytoplasmic iron level regulating protein YaaA (DUF328/UPF0246 family)
MIILLSPAKSLDFSEPRTSKHTLPRMLDDTNALAAIMKKKSAKELGSLMSISEKLSTLNRDRYKQYREDVSLENAKQSILAFKGDVYVGLDNETLTAQDISWAQKRVRILSGLYGVLRPLDLIQPYRLEMGTKLKTKKGKNLYTWWGDKITDLLNADLKSDKSREILNLASNEYFKAVHPDDLDGTLYDVNFLERRNGEYKFISFTAKKARGWLCRYIIDQRIDRVDDAKSFTGEGFKFNKSLSSEHELVFTRKG